MGILINFYCISWILSINRHAFKLLIISFEFWFKIGNIMIGAIASMINEYILTPNNPKYLILRFCGDIILFSNVVFALIIISMFDGLYINCFSKISLSITTTFWFIVIAIYLQFKIYDGDNTLIKLYGNLSISLLSIQINTVQILAIFSCKQAILTILRPNRCIMDG